MWEGMAGSGQSGREQAGPGCWILVNPSPRATAASFWARGPAGSRLPGSNAQPQLAASCNRQGVHP